MKQKKTKTILITSLAMALSASLIAGGILKKGGGEARENASQSLDDETDVTSHGISVSHIGTVQNAKKSIKTFSYTITPANASKEVNLSLYWKDATYEADVADYVTFAIDSEKQTITLTCSAPFDHVMEAKVTSAIDESLYATLELNYVQRFISFVENYEGRVKGETVLGEDLLTVTSLSDQEAFLTSQKTQSTARYYPKFSVTYTKPYPSGYNATYTVNYAGTVPWVQSEFLNDDALQARIQKAIDEVESASEESVWLSDAPSVVLEGVAKVYEKLSYSDQRRLNKEGVIGVARSYDCLIYLDEGNRMTYTVRWALKADVTKLRSYLADVTVGLETTSIDF